MGWRQRTAAETFNTNVGLPLFSDVVQLAGVSGGSSPYVMEMSYDTAAVAAVNGSVGAGRRGCGRVTSKTGPGGTWQIATADVGGTPISAGSSGYLRCALAAVANSVAQMVGSWGVDTAEQRGVGHGRPRRGVRRGAGTGTLALLAAGPWPWASPIAAARSRRSKVLFEIQARESPVDLRIGGVFFFWLDPVLVVKNKEEITKHPLTTKHMKVEHGSWKDPPGLSTCCPFR